MIDPSFRLIHYFHIMNEGLVQKPRITLIQKNGYACEPIWHCTERRLT